MARIVSFLLLACLFSCTSSGYGLDDEELNIVIPTEEVVNVESKVIAHRGAWRENGLPENSLAAFKAALGMDIYGAECDVRQTKDGRLVICHDAIHDGLAISKTDYLTLSEHTLDNGEPLPLLDDFLTALNDDTGKVRMVIEVKSGNLNTLLNLVYSKGVLDRVDFISFSKSVCTQLSSYGLGNKTFFLNGTWTPQSAQGLGLGGIDYSYQVLDGYPYWINEAQELGLQVWTWTVNDTYKMRDYLEQGVYVTTDYPIKAREIEKELAIKH